MAFFDTFTNPMDNQTNNLAAPVNPSSGGFFDGMNIFGTSIPTGIFDPAQEEKLRKQALTQGLLGGLATYIATPKNLGAGSALPYLGKAFLGGMSASRDVSDRAISNLKTQREFQQFAFKHLLGGCRKCADELHASKQRKTNEEYIEQAKRIHGDLYDYSKIDYLHNKKKS
jgi:hypothetical protein